MAQSPSKRRDTALRVRFLEHALAARTQLTDKFQFEIEHWRGMYNREHELTGVLQQSVGELSAETQRLNKAIKDETLLLNADLERANRVIEALLDTVQDLRSALEGR